MQEDDAGGQCRRQAVGDPVFEQRQDGMHSKVASLSLAVSGRLSIADVPAVHAPADGDWGDFVA